MMEQFSFQIRQLSFPPESLCQGEIKYSTDKNIFMKICKCENFTSKLISDCYTAQYLKYESVARFSKCFTGIVEDGGNKVIGNISPIVDDSQIHGSTKWRDKKEESMKERMDQLGSCCLHIKVKIGSMDEESKATVLLIEGKTVTCQYTGDDEMILHRKYFVHQSHNSATVCPPDCVKTPLEEYLLENQEEYKFESSKWISVFNSSVYIKLSSIVRNLISCHNFQLFSEDFTFTLGFDIEGSAVIDGVIWPKKAEPFNEELSNSSYTGIKDEAIRSEFLSFIDGSLAATTDITTLMEKFSINQVEASFLKELVKQNQTGDDLRQMPSLVTMLKVVPEPHAMHNIHQGREMIQYLKTDIMESERQDLDGQTTQEWLQDLNDVRADTNYVENENQIQIKFRNAEFNFIIERRLTDLIVQYPDSPFSGIYQYALTCVNYDDQNSITLQRKRLEDCFISSFNPQLLVALNCRVEVHPINGQRDWIYSSRYDLCSPRLQDVDIETSVEASNNRISLNEVANQLSKRSKDHQSRSLAFVNSKKDAQPLFLKVSGPTEETFTAADQAGFFEMTYNAVVRHKLRVNGDDLILAETSCCFDFIGRKESAELYSVYSESLDKIPPSEVKSSISGKFLPSLIICSNGHVLRIRKKRKILSYPR